MFNIRPTRFVRRHYRAALIWAAMPLAVFNGRTVVGCGCFGHFESECHCGCCSEMQDGGKHHGKPTCACCAGHGFGHSSCPCCNHSGLAHQCSSDNSDSQSACGRAIGEHHCKSMVRHEVTPVTVASITDAGVLHVSFFALAAFCPPRYVSESHVGRVVDFDTGPLPSDLVVTLHRLVI